MRKVITIIISFIFLVTFLYGCRSSKQFAASVEGDGTPSGEGTSTAENSLIENEEISTIHTLEIESTETGTPKEMTMDEIVEELGFGYNLPNEEAFDGEIYCTLTPKRDAIALSITSNEFVGRVIVWKALQTGKDEYETWSQWAEAGRETMNGIEIRFRGKTEEEKGIAFWQQNGYQYVLNCETAAGADIMWLLPLFMEIE